MEMDLPKKAQAVPGMEAADPEMVPGEHDIYAPGYGKFKNRSFKREALGAISRLQEAVRLDHWHEAHNIIGVVESMIKGMKTYMSGTTPPMEGEAPLKTAELMKKEATLGLRCATIRHEGGQWKLYSHAGKVLGAHATKEAALAQEVAVNTSK